MLISGKDTFILDNTIINDFGNGKVSEIRFPNNSAEMEFDKQGNAIITHIANGVKVEVNLIVLKNGTTDIFLNEKLTQFNNDPASYIAIKAQFIKRTGDGQGVVKKGTYNLEAGVVIKYAESEEDTTGDMAQATSTYQLNFKLTNYIVK